MLKCDASFDQTHGAVTIAGRLITDEQAFRDGLLGPVRDRLSDAAAKSTFDTELRGLVSTEMSAKTLAQVLASEPDPLDWQIGEALAEIFLSEQQDVIWPWNDKRDLKTPRASLPGADIVGFLLDQGTTVLLLGEVKTSSDLTTPPGVMSGRSGMIYQLEQLAANTGVHHSLFYWLWTRCQHTAEYAEQFKVAMGNYLHSRGQRVALAGVLIRDTTPNLLDLVNRGKALSKIVVDPMRSTLWALYVPTPIDKWAGLLGGAS